MWLCAGTLIFDEADVELHAERILITGGGTFQVCIQPTDSSMLGTWLMSVADITVYFTVFGHCQVVLKLIPTSWPGNIRSLHWNSNEIAWVYVENQNPDLLKHLSFSRLQKSEGINLCASGTSTRCRMKMILLVSFEIRWNILRAWLKITRELMMLKSDYRNASTHGESLQQIIYFSCQPFFFHHICLVILYGMLILSCCNSLWHADFVLL